MEIMWELKFIIKLMTQKNDFFEVVKELKSEFVMIILIKKKLLKVNVLKLIRQILHELKKFFLK